MVEVANEWRKQFPGEFFFSHGSNHSCGVAILVHKSLDFKLISLRIDNEGRYLILEAINKCYSPAGRAVLGKTVPEVSSRTRDRGHSFSQYGPTKAGE